jgi:hypothetical protein
MAKRRIPFESESVESLRRQLDTHRRNIKCVPREERLRFQISIEWIEKRLAELEQKIKPPAKCDVNGSPEDKRGPTAAPVPRRAVGGRSQWPS